MSVQIKTSGGLQKVSEMRTIGSAGTIAEYEQTGFLSQNLMEATIDGQTLNGLTFVKNDDGSYTVNGTATARTFQRITLLANCGLENGKRYRLTGVPITSNNYAVGIDSIGRGNPLYDFTNDTSLTSAYVYIMVENGATCNNMVFKPMITSNMYAQYDNFTPYAPSNIELKETVDSLSPSVITNDYWDSTKAYAIGDVVIYLNGLYSCVTANTGQLPTTSYWRQISLSDITTPKRVSNETFITMESGYSLVETHIHKQGYHVFGDICVKATTPFNSTAVTVGNINSGYRPIWAIVPVCVLGVDEWSSYSVGYCFISNGGLLRFADLNNTGNKKVVKLHIDYMAYD